MPRGRRSKSNSKNKKLDLQVVSLIVASILLAVLIYSKSGYIGEKLSPILGGIMGWIKYIIPIGILAIAIYMTKDEEKESFWKIIIQYSILLLCISVVITVLQVYRGKLNINVEFEEAVKMAYNDGTQNIGGRSCWCNFWNCINWIS